jgi:diguanylate cyclase (GGDEF)-like protein
MNISILVYGRNNFLATLPDQIREQPAWSVEVIADLNQAVSRIQNTPPEIILVQASCDGSMELCYWLKAQRKLSWVYCILLEDRPQMLTYRSQFGGEWEQEMTSFALKQGADAYLWLDDTRHSVYTQEEVANHNLAELTANQELLLAYLTVALRKAQKYRELLRTNDVLSAIALADSLTELNNRRALEYELPKQIQKARLNGTSLSLIILDIDHFKKINDTYGHLVGDSLLQLVCQRLRNNLRFQDIPFRYGGDEFVILLGETTGEQALFVARHLNRVIGEQSFSINNGNLLLNITISLGCTSLQESDDVSGHSLLERADRYLLQAKAVERNCVISSDNDVSQSSHLQVVSC